ncbi:superoxide dismutase [Paraclostridium sp. AKS81]|uniref:superoxide dismutase n=1 Tax=Paraclostridium sp. AKS81 TaxID=2876117 RepID=UPI000691DB9D
MFLYINSYANMPDNKEFKLEPLPYAYDSLEPYIDKDTMILHHDKHHQAYVDNLNKILSTHPEIEYKNLEQLLSNPTILPRDVRQSILNNAGGVYNHNFFWSIMSPNKGGQAKDELLKAIEKDFGSFQSFKEKFNKSALSTFGSGWTWLVSNDEGELAIMSTSNQDSPITSGIKPIIAIDLWEHSYYLKYKNERNKYIENWWNVVNWEQANKNYLSK